MHGFIYGTDNFYYKSQCISYVWHAYIIGWMHWITREVYSALPGSKQPDQAPTVCLPKITCELVFIGTPAACCHSAHLPASWKGCTGWPPQFSMAGIIHRRPSNSQRLAQPTITNPPPSCSPAPGHKKGPGLTHLFQRCLAFHKRGVTTGEFKCVSQNQ